MGIWLTTTRMTSQMTTWGGGRFMRVELCVVCLVNVFVIGVKKCGTSDLFFRLSLHPDFEDAGFKEAPWFASQRFFNHGSMDNYTRMFRSASHVIETQAKNNSVTKPFNYQTITGEGSPSNLHINRHWMNLPGNEGLEEPKYVILDYIKHLIPTAKIMIIFRDPIERLYSDYYHEFGYLQKHNKPNPAQFHTVVKDGIHLYRECFKRHSVRSCVYNPKLYDSTKIQLGIYYIFSQDLIRVFPSNQILVLQNKNLRDKGTTMTTVYEFLEMRKLTEKELHNVVNKQETLTRKQSFKDQGPMLNETFDMLQAFYQPFNDKMEEITNDKHFLYQLS